MDGVPSAGWPLTLMRLASSSAPPAESWAYAQAAEPGVRGSLSVSRLL